MRLATCLSSTQRIRSASYESGVCIAAPVSGVGIDVALYFSYMQSRNLLGQTGGWGYGGNGEQGFQGPSRVSGRIPWICIDRSM